MKCNVCGEHLKGKQKIFCSISCFKADQYIKFIERWKAGNEKGYIGLNKTLSKHIRKYMLKKENYTCQICGWDKKHPIDGLPLVEIHHIDGNCENTLESNLQVLCPNCHSMTNTFRRRNESSKRIRS